ncbi:hypothetical protein M408DRAFT_127931 [Serendipita vermifera MAFF 305830]|uniref:Wings apart-like protein C-terminal domain-containing protein n=1 Tax=Serendipita vermifera MAFF 305830 TaxID=933852 RepID=A0A0C3AX36_SERVB|nr:hypothetical protein M408DRAFT_127931 [Serendipita vermifera MAFF 305830]
MSARRARVQYGKAAKRVNSRISSDIVQTSEQEEEVAPEDGGNQHGVAKGVKAERSTSKVIVSTETGDVPRRKISRREAGGASKSPVRKIDPIQDVAPRKRKRDTSPTSSDREDVVDKPAKTLKVLKGGSPARKGAAPALPLDARKTPSRPTTPSKPGVSTPKLTRDLSDLFISPHKPTISAVTKSPAKPGVLKRMLSKSKTEPALEEAPTRADLFPSKSTIATSEWPPKDTPVIPNDSIPSFNRHPLASNRTPSPTPIQGTRPISRSPQKVGRTYSKSRSFLVEIPRDADPMDVDSELPKPSTLPEDPDLKDMHRESYSELRSRWGIDTSDQDPTLNTPTNDLNSIGEMRSRGETRRFLDEVGYLFDGLDPSTGRSNTGAKRASAIEIVSKMGNPEFARRAAAANFVTKAWSMLRGAGAGTGDDKILDAALIAFAALSMKDSRQAIELCRTSDLLPFLSLCIGVSPEEDVLVVPPAGQESIWARKLGLSRTDQTNLTILRTAVANSIVLANGEDSSHRFLAAQTLSSLLEFGQSLTSDVLDAILSSLASELSRLRQTSPSLEELDASSEMRYSWTCLRIAEKAITNSPASNPRQTELLPHLSWLINQWPALVGSADSTLDESIQLALQFLVRSTHDNADLSEVVAEQPTLIHNLLRLFARWYRAHFSASQLEDAKTTQPEEDEPDLLTRASLSLALVTQLVKQGDTAKAVLQQTKMATSCPFTGSCTEQCQCSQQVSGIEILVEIFNEPEDTHDAKADYFRGHIGILLSLLCLHDQKARSILFSLLQPSQGTENEKIGTLISAVREFSTVWSAVVNTVSQGDDVSVDDHRPDIPQDEGAKLAQTVIEGLEGLLKEGSGK